MRAFACRGWCQRVYIEPAGLPAHALVRAAARGLCPMCDNTIQCSLPKQDSRLGFALPQDDSEPVAPPVYFASAHPRLHKKLNARHHTIRIEDTGEADIFDGEARSDDEYVEDEEDASIHDADDDTGSSVSEDIPSDDDEPKIKYVKMAEEDEMEEDHYVSPSMLSKLCLILVNFYYAHPACLMQEPYRRPLCYICGTFAPQAAFCRSCKMRLRVNARQQLRQ